MGCNFQFILFLHSNETSDCLQFVGGRERFLWEAEKEEVSILPGKNSGNAKTT